MVSHRVFWCHMRATVCHVASKTGHYARIPLPPEVGGGVEELKDCSRERHGAHGQNVFP